MRKGDLKLVQELNRSIILNKIRSHGPISRISIAKECRVSPSTVASAVQELIKEGYVSELGAGKSSGGRKPILLKFAPDNHYIIVIAITNSSIELAELNLEARIRRKHLKPVKGQKGVEIIRLMTEELDLFMQDSAGREQCIGIAVTVPGVVNVEKGIVYYNSKLRLENVPLKEMIEQRYGLPTWIENDANAVVLAERRFGSCGEYPDLIYIVVGDGVGAGILVNDSVLRGNSGGAGEFGHTSVSRSGIRCECGNVGCLENVISWTAVYSRIVASITSGRPTVLNELCKGNFSEIRPSLYKEAIRLGDALSNDINEEIAEHLSAGMINLVNLFNPGAIILDGSLAYDNPKLLEQIRERVQKHGMRILKDGIRITQSSLGPDRNLIGGAAVILRQIFRFSLAEN
ncbi:ROK family transcriptional regulator [Paenibacillus sp. KQZ6P-2]|uniref:ROK family transcriptional regulator n=1 Tax=Paenibacillus mangrovi TaxID=2931978 RepID=A0A9X2B3P6_9BACL|nr:ROK family transcriptional regulator [Paenibacillus mangrovi]MCJ8013829.1 ROK family transcriptional regulator [Paenibacillus mangrovi]